MAGTSSGPRLGLARIARRGSTLVAWLAWVPRSSRAEEVPVEPPSATVEPAPGGTAPAPEATEVPTPAQAASGAPAGAWTLGPNDRLEVTLVGGTKVEGWPLVASPGTLVVWTTQGPLHVDRRLLEAVVVDGEPQDPQRFQRDLDAWVIVVQEEARTAPRPPRPWVVASASVVLWSGAGLWMVDDPKQAWGFTGVEAALLGAGAYSWWGVEQPEVAVGLGVIDAIVRVGAARQAARRAHALRDRARLYEELGLR